MEHDDQSQPNIRRAFRALLGNAYEEFQMEHIALSSLAELSGGDFDTAWAWRRVSIEDAASTASPATYPAMLITDAGSAVIPPHVWYDRDDPIGPRIAAFVAALKATFIVASYASMSGRKTEHYTLIGTDGFTAREAHWSVEYKSFGKRTIRPMRRREGKRADTLTAIGTGDDPTTELPPWDDSFFLSDAAFELRENRDSGAREEGPGS